MTEKSIPHVCGRDPVEHVVVSIELEYSPCMWG